MSVEAPARLRPEGLAPLFWNVPPGWVSSPTTAEQIAICALPDKDGRAGWSFDPWQRSCLDLVNGEDDRGEWAARVTVIIVSRQQGKTDRVLVPVALHHLLVMPPEENIYSAHNGKTMRGAFVEIVRKLQTVPSLAAKVKKITDSAGKERIEMRNGASMDFIARTRGGGRGFSVGGCIILDEGLFLSDEALDAIVPTIIAKSGPRIVIASTAGLVESRTLRALRDRGRAHDPGIAYVEYGLPPGMWCELGLDCDHARGRMGCICDNPAAVRASCPGVACGRISLEIITGTVRSLLTPSGFMREIFSVWDEPASASRISFAQWQQHADADSRAARDAAPVYAFDVSVDGAFSTLHVAASRDDGRAHLERVESQFGTGWLVGALTRLPAGSTVIADARGPAYALAKEIDGLGIEVTWVNTVEVTAAAVALQIQTSKAKADSDIRHTGDEGMVDAFTDAFARGVGDGMWLWARSKSAPGVSKLIATSLALWGLLQQDDLSGYDPLDYIA